MSDISTYTLTDACFTDYLTTIHNFMGITINRNRKAMLIGRMRKRVNELGVEGYEDYLNVIKSDSSEKQKFINLITTNETYFYRTPRIWNFIENTFLKDWHTNNSNQTVNIWSAASSSGEEAYTLGIICQHFKSMHSDFKYRIIGTDISSSVINIANTGVYKGRSIERFKKSRPDLFDKYMIGDNESGYRVISSIKSNISFNTHNLFEKYSENESFNLVLLRNVLIYFSKQDQEKSLINVMRCLDKDGFLIIGESESLNQLEINTKPVAPLVYQHQKLHS